jgi:hypothetical protein
MESAASADVPTQKRLGYIGGQRIRSQDRHIQNDRLLVDSICAICTENFVNYFPQPKFN